MKSNYALKEEKYTLYQTQVLNIPYISYFQDYIILLKESESRYHTSVITKQIDQMMLLINMQQEV